MKRADFFKSLLALPLLSFFGKEREKAEPTFNSFKASEADYVYTITDADREKMRLMSESPCRHVLVLVKDQLDPKMNGTYCIKCNAKIILSSNWAAYDYISGDDETLYFDKVRDYDYRNPNQP